MTTDRPPCPKCQQAMQLLFTAVNGKGWWKCACDRKTYLMQRDVWIVLRTGTEDQESR